MSGRDAYAGSDAVRLLKSGGMPARLAFLDIDSTLTGDPAGADRVRDLLVAQGYCCVFITSRTEEMVMTSAAAQASRRSGELERPEPLLGRRGERRLYLPPEQVEPRGILDGEIIAGSSGSRIFVRHGGAYVRDDTFGKDALAPRSWRQQALALVSGANGTNPVAEPAPIEAEASYREGIGDVFPPDYRVELHFATAAAEREFRRRLAALRRSGADRSFARGVHLLDDSHPAEGRHKVFLLPRWASKARAGTHIVSALCAHMDAGTTFDLLLIGDSLPDLYMGLFGAPARPATLYLVSGSRLADVLLSPTEDDFGAEPLGAIKRRLGAGDSPGVYRFRIPLHERTERRVVFGGVLFPGSTCVRSIERFLMSAVRK